VRRIPLPATLREELTLWKADTAHNGPDDYVIHTSTGRRHNPSNLRRDVRESARLAARYGPASPLGRAGKQQYFASPFQVLN
jgi:hypothetical protein